MSFLDMKTVVFTNMLTSVVCMLVILVLWAQVRRRFEGAGFWVIDFVFQTTAIFLIVLRGSIPDWISMVLSNTLVLTGALLGYVGLGRFTGKRLVQVHNYVLLAAFVGVHAYFSLVQPNLAVRNLNISLGLLLICLQCAGLLLFRVEPATRRLTRNVGLVFGAYCLISILRVVRFFIVPHLESDFFESGPFDTFVVVSYQTLFILLTYFLVLMFNERLLAEIKTQEDKFHKAFHASPYALTLTRLSDGKIIEVNKGFSEISGFSAEGVLGKSTIDLHLWEKAEDRAAVAEELSRNGKVRESEFQFRRKSGVKFTGLFSAEIIRTNDQELALSRIGDITERKRAEEEREKLIQELRDALEKVRLLSGMLPICSSCKKIRDDKGYWTQIESYVRRHSEADFSHSICPDCARKLYPDANPYDDDENNERRK